MNIDKHQERKMKYILSIRKLTEEDLSRCCCFLPDVEFFESHIEAFIDDVQELKNIVLDVKREAQTLIIQINISDKNVTIFEKSLKLLLGNYFDKFRVDSKPRLVSS